MADEPIGPGDLDAMDRDERAAIQADANGASNAVRYVSSDPDETDGERAPSRWEALVTPAPVEWFTTKPAARAWLLRDARRPKADGLLPLGKVGQLIAEGGAGKTMAAFQLAVSVATLVPWLGAFDVAIPGQDGRPRAGRVLVIVGEEDADEAHRRLYRARKATNAPIPQEGSIVVLPLAGVPCPMLERDQAGNLRSAPFLLWLRRYVEAHGPWHVIVVDPLSRFAGPDAEIDNAAATRFIQSLESISTLTDATVLVCHHTNKLSRKGGAVDSSAGRGSTALVDGARWECSLGVERVTLDDPAAQERLGTLVTWAHTKSNYSRRAEGLVLRSDGDNGGALVPLDPADLEAVQAARGRDPGQVGQGPREGRPAGRPGGGRGRGGAPGGRRAPGARDARAGDRRPGRRPRRTRSSPRGHRPRRRPPRRPRGAPPCPPALPAAGQG